MASVLDTSALIPLLRRTRPAGREGVREVATAEIREGAAVLSAVTVTELVVGARDARAMSRVLDLLARLSVMNVDRELAVIAGRMGSAARASGATLPVPDLLIAATALRLGLPLLTCDSDFARARALARLAGPEDPWYGFRVHPASALA